MRRLSPPTVRIKAYGDQEVRMLGSIVLYMHTNEKADRVIWQFTDTMAVPILSRTQEKLMNCISYPEIHAPQQQQSSVSQDSIKSTDHVHSLVTMQHSRQSNPKFDWKFDQKFDWSKFDQTAQEEHRVVAKAKLGAAHEPKSPQVLV